MSERSRERKNRVIAMMASLALVVGLVPVPALAAAGSGEPPVDSSPAAVPAAEPAVTPVEESSKVAAPVEEGSEAAAPAEEESKAAIPVEEPSKTAAPVEDESKAAAPAEESSKVATPAEETGKAPAAEYPAFKQNATVGGVTVTVEAGAGAFPEGARLSVTAVSSSATEAAVAPERGAGESVAASYTFDIKVLEKGGEEVQPANGKSVKVSFAAAEVADPNLDVSVYHVSGGAAEELPVSESGSTATAESGGFSYYTVEFTYGDLQYVLPGGSEVALSEVLAAVGLVGEPEAVEVSDPALFSASDESGAWVVTSHQAFSSTEWMRVTIAGQSYEVEVTDAQPDTRGTLGTWPSGATTCTLTDDGTFTVTGTGAMADYGNSTDKAPWREDSGMIEKVVIEDGVTNIGSYAFRECANITGVEIPSSVTSMGRGAFSGCNHLTGVVIPSGVTTIGDYAFDYCTSLTSVDIPYGVTTIGECAFGDCNGLESVKIPSSVTTIGKQAFYQCGFTGVDIPSSVTTIGEGAFQGCSSLESVTIPDSVTSIGKVAFHNCTSLKSVTIPSSVTSVEYATFQGCIGLGSVTIPSSVTTIGVHAFSGCNHLTGVVIPSGVTSIEADAFEGCSRLTVVEIPSSVTSIGNYVFTSCKKLSAIKYDGTLEKWDSIDLKGDWAYNTPTDMVVICKYDGTVECNPQTGGTADARVEIKPNDEHPSPASIATAVPNAEAGYHFVSWTGDEGVSFADPTELETSFTATEAVPTITANFAKTFEVDNVEDQTYSGQDLTPVLTVKDAVTGSNLAKGDYSVSYQKKDGNPVTEIKNAGEYKVIVTGKNDYTGTTIEKPFTVEQAELTITAKDQSYTYTGYQQGEGDPAYDDPEIIKTKVDAEGLQGDDKITSIVLNGSQTDAGVYEGDSDGIVPSAAAIGVGGALNGNYKIAYVNGMLTIEPAKVTVTTGSASKVYDGKALTNAEASIEGLVKGESATVKATGSQTEVGSSKNTCSIEWGTAKARNYAVTEKLGTLTVEAAPVQEYTVTFVNWDGTVLQSGKVAAGEVPVYEGAEPTRPETDQYLYVFDGWTPEVAEVTGDATYTAVFEPVLRTYDVIWLNDDGTELYRDVHVPYGQMPDYDGPTPTKPADDKYTYTFSGWAPEVVAVTGDATYTATYTETPIPPKPTEEYTVTFANWDGTVLQSGKIAEGELPKYEGDEPTKPADDKYTYTFSGWAPEVVAVTGDATYTATYAATPKDKPVYKVISGAGGSWTAGSGEPMVFKIERTIDPETAFSHFIGINVDGKALPEKDASGKANWTARSGSVIVELQPAYLGTLSEGKHTLTALFDDGDPVTAEFKVAAKASPSPDKPAKGTSPKTGDPLAGAFVATIATAIIALIVMVAFAVRRRRA